MAVTYDRPVNAKLFVHLDNGEKWEANPDDLQKWGFINGHDAYIRWERHIAGVLRAGGMMTDDDDMTDSELNPLRYITELILCYPPDFLSHADGEVNEAVVAIEKKLQALTYD